MSKTIEQKRDEYLAKINEFDSKLEIEVNEYAENLRFECERKIEAFKNQKELDYENQKDNLRRKVQLLTDILYEDENEKEIVYEVVETPVNAEVEEVVQSNAEKILNVMSDDMKHVNDRPGMPRIDIPTRY